MKRSLFAVAGLITVAAGNVAAQAITVFGTGDPRVDIPAVQAAVDQGGQVVLTGHFSFDMSPTTPAGAAYSRIVTVAREVVILGKPDQQGEMPAIQGGSWPFLIDAPGTHVTIQGLRFVGPTAGAIWVYSSGGLAITDCRIESVATSSEFATEAGQANPLASAIFVGANPHPPSAAQPGQPENFSGTFLIANNDIDVGGAGSDQTLGITIFAVGKLTVSEVDMYVSGNKIRNVTEPAVNFRYIGGRAHVERNTITTGPISGGTPNPDAVRAVGTGSYLIAHNSIDCGWADGTATGINVIGQPSPLAPEAGAIVTDNDVTMSAPEGSTFSAGSAGIQIKGFAQGNSVVNNRIRGRARAALAVSNQNGGIPANSTFVGNDSQDFQSSIADIIVDAGAANTVIVGRQSKAEDHGSGTIVVPMP